jgi:hypothetical protein
LRRRTVFPSVVTLARLSASLSLRNLTRNRLELFRFTLLTYRYNGSSVLGMAQRTKIEAFMTGHHKGKYTATVKELYVDSGQTKRIVTELAAADYQDLLDQIHGATTSNLSADCRACLDHLRQCAACIERTN